jgi:uncharacterized membrane protein
MNAPMSNKNKGLPQNPAQVKQVISSSFSGPLPHPEVLRGYESVQPGAAERIIKMAENEAIHRHSLERNGQKSFVNNERLGMLCALFICLVALMGGFLCILKGHPTAGTILSATPLGVIVTVFIQGRKK